MIRLASLLLLAGVCAGCSASQDAEIIAGADTLCHTVTALEAADPAFVAHNGKVVAGQQIGCTLVGLIPVTATSAPAAPTTTAAPTTATAQPAS